MRAIASLAKRALSASSKRSSRCKTSDGPVASSEPHVHDAFARGDFTTALKTLAGLREAVDTFFDGVMVMADDTALRDNRLALLGELHGLMNRVADISKLAA